MLQQLYKLYITLVCFSLFAYAEKDLLKDTLVVHGMTLSGKIIDLGSETLSFKLLYSRGVNRIAYKDIDSISTKHKYHISFKNTDVEGYIVGLKENKYLDVMENNRVKTIRISDIDSFVISLEDDDSLENYLKNSLPYLKGNINVGLTLEQGSSKKNKMDILFHLHHKKTVHEIEF